MVDFTVGPVSVYATGGTSPASVTGDPPQWSDDSDETFATVTANNSLGSQYVGAEVTGDATGVTELTMRVRFLLDAGNHVGDGDRIQVHWYVGEDDTGATRVDGTLGALADLTVPVIQEHFNDGYSLAGFLTAITDGTASVRVLCGSPGILAFTNTATVYELNLAGDLLEVRTKAPACRKFPRDDSLGVGSGRHWPRPSTQQSSPRRGPTTTY